MTEPGLAAALRAWDRTIGYSKMERMRAALRAAELERIVTEVQAPGYVAPPLCGDMTGPNGVGGECVLLPGHPHLDGIDGAWPVSIPDRPAGADTDYYRNGPGLPYADPPGEPVLDSAAEQPVQPAPDVIARFLETGTAEQNIHLHEQNVELRRLLAAAQGAASAGTGEPETFSQEIARKHEENLREQARSDYEAIQEAKRRAHAPDRVVSDPGREREGDDV